MCYLFSLLVAKLVASPSNSSQQAKSSQLSPLVQNDIQYNLIEEPQLEQMRRCLDRDGLNYLSDGRYHLKNHIHNGITINL